MTKEEESRLQQTEYMAVNRLLIILCIYGFSFNDPFLIMADSGIGQPHLTGEVRSEDLFLYSQAETRSHLKDDETFPGSFPSSPSPATCAPRHPQHQGYIKAPLTRQRQVQQGTPAQPGSLILTVSIK